MNKKTARLRRAKRTRYHIRRCEAMRLCVHKTAQHIYAQITTPDGAKTLVAASTLEQTLQKQKALKSTGNIHAAEAVGQLIAERAVQANITAVAFDRAGYKYHGRIKALADAARAGGLVF